MAREASDKRPRLGSARSCSSSAWRGSDHLRSAWAVFARLASAHSAWPGPVRLGLPQLSCSAWAGLAWFFVSQYMPHVPWVGNMFF